MRHLLFIYRGFVRETALIESVFNASVTIENEHARIKQFAKEMSVVRLHDAWGRFWRSIAISCAIGNVIDESGRVITGIPNARGSSVVLDILRGSYGNQRKPPYWEPRWYDAGEFIDATNRLQILNRAALNAAAAATPSPNEDLRWIRNSLVHRSERSAARIKPLIGNKTVIDYMEETVSPGVPRVRLWIAQLRLQANAAIR